MTYPVRERMLGIGEDFWIKDENGRKAFLVDGKALRLRETFELKDAAGTVLLEVKAKRLAIRDTMTVENAAGEKVATVAKKVFTPLRDQFVAEVHDGTKLEITGSLLDKEYGIIGPQGPVAQISRKWFRLRDTYGVDIAPGQDEALIIAIAVCVDRLTAHRQDGSS
jgi:uncharacterized protein YxjI